MISDNRIAISLLKKEVEDFIRERAWEKYHNPKNVSESILIEAAELLEIFQWVSTDESLEHARKNIEKVKDELADVLIYCLSLANVLDIDVSQIVIEKLRRNKEKYPVERYYGRYEKTPV